METFCSECVARTEHVAVSDIIKDKKPASNGYYYWQKVECTKCRRVHWVDRRKDEKEKAV